MEALTQLGGIASSAELLGLTTRKRLRRAVQGGSIHKIRRDRYRLAEVDLARARAVQLRGRASHLTAALLHGWEVAHPPTCPWITVPRNVEVPDREGAYVFWADLTGEPEQVTSPVRTVIDCARRLAFGPALAVADSALRHENVTTAELVTAAAKVRGKGAAQARRVARHASGLAANPFESVLRALALDAGLDAQPQVEIMLGTITIHPDIVDVDRRIVLEADSWEHHASREDHDSDCERYTLLVVRGWRVLRFTWRQVMRDPDFVSRCLDALTPA